MFRVSPTGSLTHQNTLKVAAIDGAIGLRGVRALFLTNDRLYAASFVDKAVAAFARHNTTGALTYIGHVGSGERQIARFPPPPEPAPLESPPAVRLVVINETAVNETYTDSWIPGDEEVGARAAWFTETFPMQFGGETVEDVKHSPINGRELFVVALGATASAGIQGRVVVYEVLEGVPVLVQTLDAEVNVTAIESLFTIDLEDVGWHYLVFAKATGASTIYRYNPSLRLFYFFNAIPLGLPDGTALPPSCAALGLCDSTIEYTLPGLSNGVPPWAAHNPIPSARSAKAFVVDDLLYLAIAYWWDEMGEYTWFSYIYRWQPYGTVLVGDGTLSSGIGFETFQIVPTQGAVDVATTTWEEPCALDATQTCRQYALIWANFGFPSSEGNANIMFYSSERYNAITGTGGGFYDVQSLPADGASAVTPFTISGALYLAVAAHGSDALVTAYMATDNLPWSLYGGTASTAPLRYGSKIYRWDSPEGRFVEAQSLESVPSVSNSGAVVAGLVGATGVQYFAHDGEHYLFLAQALCTRNTAAFARKCLAQQRQPRSAILQWNRITSQFGELLATTDMANVRLRGIAIPDLAHLIHNSAALRIASGMRASFTQLPTISLLFVSSATRGAAVYDWDFEEVVGLDGPVSLGVDQVTRTSYTASRDSAALVTLQERVNKDAVGHALSALTYLSTRSDRPIRMSRTTTSEHEGVEGLAGASRVSLISVDNCRGGGACAAVAVLSGPNRDELLCGASPILPKWSFPLTSAGSSALPCQQVSFTVVETASTNPNLFTTSPYLAVDGSLSFVPAPGQYGQARFSATLQDDGLRSTWVHYVANFGYKREPKGVVIKGEEAGEDMSEAQVFVVTVLPVNDPPTFDAVPIMLVQNGNAANTFIFARNLTAGANNEASQTLAITWKWFWLYFPEQTCDAEQMYRPSSLFTSDSVTDEEGSGLCQDLCDADPTCVFAIYSSRDLFPCKQARECRKGEKVSSTLNPKP